MGITQKELAEKMGIAYRTINAWSNGKTKTPEWAIKMEIEYKSLKNRLVKVVLNDSEMLQILNLK